MASSADTQSLDTLIDTTTTLLSQFRIHPSSSSPSTTATPAPTDPTLNPLHILRDASKLLKAHTTKLSLLAINKPFTPSAIRKVLSPVTSTCLPALMSAAQRLAANPHKWSKMLVKEVEHRLLRLFDQFKDFLRKVQKGGDEKGSLASTGLVWQGCEELIEVETLGIGGLAVIRAQRYRETIQDAIEELEEWKEGEDLETEGRDELVGSDDEGFAGDEFEDLFHAANSMPKDRPELVELVEEAVGMLKKVVLFYKAVEKRRLEGFKREFGEEEVERLDRIMALLESIPHEVDDIAGAFYELQEDQVRETRGTVLVKMIEVAKLLKLDWEQQTDQFSEWSAKWIKAVEG